jgi:hypothetical protein
LMLPLSGPDPPIWVAAVVIVGVGAHCFDSGE